MINASRLLADLTRQLKRLEDDLRRRIGEEPALDAALRAEWQSARDADRCAEPYPTWAEQVITQAGVHWLLSCVFLRFIEDNRLVDRPWLGGPPEPGPSGNRLALARDRHEAYFQSRPLETDSDYLLAAFRDAGTLPGLHTFFDAQHNPVFRLAISGDAGMALRQFWQQVDPNTGALVHDFSDPSRATRFLGDLYQDLSEATRKRYALLQTPEFVEEFILDRTLTPAIHQFGFREVRLLDPTCGSGHFLLGAFHRLVAEWQRHEPGRNPVDIAQKALDAVAGVDLNPFAVAISRFRLWIAALQVAGIRRLADAPDFRVSVAIGDSLLHGSRFGLSESQPLFDAAASHAGTGLAHAYASEDLAEVQRILGRQYHAVVGNPPYIVVKDAALNAAYRRKYPASCHMKYSLGAPFTQRFFELALPVLLPLPPAEGGGERGDERRGSAKNPSPAGYIGLITANSFMKREFGAKLIEQVLPRLDLTHVVDTSGAYIPGHGTPTVILFGRHRKPVDGSVRTVMGIKGEPSTPDDPAKGLVWSAIVGQIDQAGSESEFVSVADTPRATFGKHPWSIGGGGASDLREQIEDGRATLGSIAESLGFASFTGADEVFAGPASAFVRKRFPLAAVRAFVVGDGVRDYQAGADESAFAPYLQDLSPMPLDVDSPWGHEMWAYRASLEGVVSFAGKTRKECGDKWWTWYRWVPSKYRASFSITFAEVATHNHFVLDRGGKVFKQTAPVIKLPAGSSEDDHLGLLGLLNSSVACFWLKQVCHQKQMMGGDGIRVSEKSKVPYAFASTRVQELPLPNDWRSHPMRARLTELARQADHASQLYTANSPAQIVSNCVAAGDSIAKAWKESQAIRASARARMIFVQEEIDFTCYVMYGLAERSLLCDCDLDFELPLAPGERPFCISSQRNVEGFEVPSDVPAGWPDPISKLWRSRIEALRENDALRIIEDPHYKRRWIGRQGLFNHGARADDFLDALRDWLLARLEAPSLWPASADQPPQITSTARLADAVQRDADFQQVAALYAGHADFDLHRLVADLVAAEAVPFLPVLRYTETGLRKREQWQATWALQRAEDRIDAEVAAASARRAEWQAAAAKRFGSDASDDAEALAWVEAELAREIADEQKARKQAEVGRIPVPPRYQSKDFLKADVWRLRGGLDVPKEHWISYPRCERGADSSLPIAWAGWNHLHQATALAGYYVEMKENEGWEPARLQPLLAGLDELVPWLEQWHNELDPVFGERMGSYYRGFVAEEARALGFTLDDLRAWKPAATTVRRVRNTRP